MSKCEACGGDGLIEVGAYRGDESDTTTRECRLCGGVVSIASWMFSREPLPTAVESFLGVSSKEVVDSLAQAESKTQLAHVTSQSGVRVQDFAIQTTSFKDEHGQSRILHEIEPWYVSFHEWAKQRGMTPKEIADEWIQRLREENERQQCEAERKQSVSQLKLTAICWYRSPDDDANTLRHCRGIESMELAGSAVKFKPAEHYECVTHIKVCAAQQSGACVIPLSKPRYIQFGDVLQITFTESELETIISTFVK